MKTRLAAILILCAAPIVASAGVTATMTDANGVTVNLTDTRTGDCNVAESVKPDGTKIDGCWEAHAGQAHISYTLPSGQSWQDTYPTKDFALTDYGRGVLKGIGYKGPQ